jgi:CheY-like chemotaxis protein
MAWLLRPIDPMHILRELDSLVEQRQSSPGDLRAALAPVGRGERSGLLSSLGDLEGAASTGPDVLVVEDSAIARRLLQVRLQDLGYRVQLARDGDEAMALLERERFALVFLDIVLGLPDGLDGLTICRQLKQDPRFGGAAAPKVVLVTGLSAATDRVRGSLAGCDAYLTKPLSDETLLQALRTLDPDGPASRRG